MTDSCKKTPEQKRAATLASVESKPAGSALTVNEVAVILNLSRWSVAELLESGAIPGFILKSGRRKRIWRCRKGALQDWISAREAETKRQIHGERRLQTAV